MLLSADMITAIPEPQLAIGPLALLFLFSAATSIASGVAQKKQAERLAKEADEQARVEFELQLRRGRQLQGAQRAATAGAGVAVSTGTPLEILAQTAADAELNALRASFGPEQDARNFRSQGQQALIGGLTGAAGTILGGANAGAFTGPSSTGTFKFPKGVTGGFDSTFKESGFA